MDSYNYFDFDASPRRHHRHGPHHHGPASFPMHPFGFGAPGFAPFGGPESRVHPHRHHFDDAEFYGRHGHHGGFHFSRHGSPFGFPHRHFHGRRDEAEREATSDSTSSDSSSDSEVERRRHCHRRWGRKHVGPFGYGRRHHGKCQRRRNEEDSTDFDIVKDVNELTLEEGTPKQKKFKFVVKARGYTESDVKVTREKDEIVVEGHREKTNDQGTFSTTINHRIRIPEGTDADCELKTKFKHGHLIVILKKPAPAVPAPEVTNVN